MSSQIIIYYLGRSFKPLFKQSLAIFDQSLHHLDLHPVMLGYEQIADETCKYKSKSYLSYEMNIVALTSCKHSLSLLCESPVFVLAIGKLKRQSRSVFLESWLLRIEVIGHLYLFSIFEKNYKREELLCINHTNVKQQRIYHYKINHNDYMGLLSICL